MADNVVANSGTGGATFATDDISSVHYPRSKLSLGADGSATDAVGGAGAVGDGVQRITLASDDPAVTALQIIDDWDETDRAKVNIIAGQSGITAGAGAVGASTPRVTLASDDPAVVALQVLDNAIVGSEMQVDVVAALPAGTNAIGKLAANSGVDIGDVDVTSISAGTNTIGGVTPRPETANGLAICRDIDLDNGTLTVVKNAAGQLYGWDITNTSTATVYVKFYDATSGTLGTGTPVLTIGIPGNSTDDTLSSKALSYGIVFATGICVGAGTGVADADNTDPGANAVVANIYYK